MGSVVRHFTSCGPETPKRVLWQTVKCHGISSRSALFTETKSFIRESNTTFLEIITCDPSLYTMDHPNFIACSFTENSIGLKTVSTDCRIKITGNGARV